MRRSFDTKYYFNLLTLRLSCVVLFLLIGSPWFLFSPPALAQDSGLTVLSDEELGAIQAQGFYFRMDLSLEAFTESNNPPQVVFNTGTPLIVPTDNTTSFSAPVSSIALTGNAQSNITSLINIIGATSVINVGLNVVSVINSSIDVINTTNINTGAQGANFDITFSLLP